MNMGENRADRMCDSSRFSSTVVTVARHGSPPTSRMVGRPSVDCSVDIDLSIGLQRINAIRLFDL